jgi:phosphatidylserine/phosphatidylglycerophosphate/cardiolipin synthase-like enzyme
MLDAFRRWLARWVMPEQPPARGPQALPPRQPAERPPKKIEDSPSKKRAEDAERNAKGAEERARALERAKAELEQALRAAEARADAATQRASNLELAAKREAKERERAGKGRRGKGQALEAKLQAASEELRATRQRARDAELRLDEVDEARRRSDANAATLEDRVKELEERLREQIERPTAAAAGPESVRRRPAAALAEAHFSPGEECLAAIRLQLSRARASVDICVFTITDDRIADAIVAAHRRGVRVRIVTDNDKAFDQGSDVRKLEAAGIEVREDRTEFHMHHKFAIFDQRVLLTGSYNWTRGAARFNEENVIVTDDARLVGPFGREFAALWGRLAPGDDVRRP